MEDTHYEPERDVERKRSELLVLASDGELHKSESFLKKANDKIIERLYAQYEAKKLEDATEFAYEQIISKFSELLGGLDAIETPSSLESELRTNHMLKKDLKSVMSWLAPLIPFIGVLSAAATVGKHVMTHTSKEPKCEPEPEKSKPSRRTSV